MLFRQVGVENLMATLLRKQKQLWIQKIIGHEEDPGETLKSYFLITNNLFFSFLL